MSSLVPPHVREDQVVDFDIYDLAAQADDFFDAWTSLQGKPPMVWTPRNGSHWIATRGETIAALFMAPELSNKAVSIPPEIGAMMDFIPLQCDAPEHGRYRAPVMKALEPRQIARLEPLIRGLARELALAARETDRFDFIAGFAEVLPIHTFLTLIDLPPEDRPMLRKLGEQLNRPDGTMTPAQLMQRVTDYMRPHVDARLAQPGDDLLSRILAATVDGRPWTADEAIRLGRNLLLGGLDTVAAMLGFVFHFLAGSPEHRAALRDRPELVPAAVKEFTRRFGSVATTRIATTDFAIGGATIAAGDIVLLPTMLYNLDESLFPDAKAVRFDRKTARHMTMGQGRHHCVGAALAQLELTIVLEEWFRVSPDFTLDPADPAVMQGGGVGSLKRLPMRLQ